MTSIRSQLAPACLIGASALLAACATTPDETTLTETTLAETTLAEASPTEATDAAATAGDKAAHKSVATLVDTGVRCRRYRTTGTHMYKKICTTAAQRQQMKEEAELLGQDGRRALDDARAAAQATRDAVREAGSTFRQ